MIQWDQLNSLYLVMALQFLVIVVGTILTLILWFRIRRIRKQFNQLLKGTSKDNLESLLGQLFNKLKEVEDGQYSNWKDIQAIQESLLRIKGNVGIVRFNAFANEGSDLSFSIAFVDQYTDGFVLTSLYGREESRIYAKPLESGASIYQLTEEEQEAIQRAKGLS